MDALTRPLWGDDQEPIERPAEAQCKVLRFIDRAQSPATGPSLSEYDRAVVFFSSGKDSVAAVLHLLDLGFPKDRIELHHHCVDGMEGSNLMDWPITHSYCKAFAKAFGLRLYFSWRVNGIEGEMMRQNSRTAPVAFETEDGTLAVMGGDRGPLGTRRKFPQVSADLTTRWCSSAAKIDVGSRVLNNEPRFLLGKTLVVTGERAEESPARSRYKTFEPHRTDNRDGARVQRWVDHWRPVHGFTEAQVWDVLCKHRVNPHPAYWLGWGRMSCLFCIFGSAHQWASAQKVAPDGFERIAQREEEFGVTIHRKLSVRQQAERGIAYDMDPSQMALAMRHHYPEDMLIVPEGQWTHPPGAFGESNGPT